MPPKKKTSSLGRAVMRNRFGPDQRRGGEGWLHTTDITDDPEGRGLSSVTETGDLEEFLTTAEMSGREFVGEKLNIKVVGPGDLAVSGAMLSAEKAKAKAEAEEAGMHLLRVPRRPAWTEETTPEELDLNERKSFLEWRRNLAVLQENEDLLLTPFEKNLEVWRQLWRVIERSDVVVQIVDGRSPLFFRCEDVATYVNEVDSKKKSLLLINKADMLTSTQRALWAKYLNEHNIPFCFWSANAETARQEKLKARMALLGEGYDEEDEESAEDSGMEGNEANSDDSDAEVSDESEEDPAESPKPAQASRRELLIDLSDDEDDEPHNVEGVSQEEVRVLNGHDLLDLFKSMCPDMDDLPLDRNGRPRRPTVGLVGYPNVGKSSTINALLGAKKVSVSATPGKTKHFQTLVIDDDLILCDCPGLVFPSFASTKAEMVCNGVLPIDHLRDPIPPMALLSSRIPRAVLEETYTMQIIKPREGEDPNRKPTAYEVLHAFGRHRGFMTAHGLPDNQKSSRVMLKDYVKGKLLYCDPPPGTEEIVFNPHLFIDGENWDASEVDYLTQANTIALYSTAGQTSAHSYKYASIEDENLIEKKNEAVVKAMTPGYSSVTKPETEIERDELGRPIGKPWKKHNNQGKKEKIRRTQKIQGAAPGI